ncbi:hypothetical protein M2444_006320 [Paenibacillus sp. PastF-3]|uniref:hypothetical protein n=1 Tax=unclassified Paenibacillus TaxID=185978 RepID=UPI0015C5F557|nr:MULTISPECIES: hypothetical protein [unclassified Paenibacillus]MDH6374462.1 hypothetical protein [Paenibacillus sp. PastF-3]
MSPNDAHTQTPLIQALQALRDIAVLTATTLVSEMVSNAVCQRRLVYELLRSGAKRTFR